MGPKPHARGRCHVANYWTAVQILSADVTGSHAIPVPREPTLLVRAVEHAALWFALTPMSTPRTGFRGVRLFLQSHNHAMPLSLIGEQMPHGPMRPLMEFLVIGGANIQVLPNMPDIANHNRLDALSMQRRDQPSCLLMFDILDLMLQFLELFLLGTNEFLSATRTFLLPIKLLAEMLLQFVAILPLGTQIPRIAQRGESR